MNYKWMAFLIIAIPFLFETYVEWLKIKSAERQIPDNVKDIYDIGKIKNKFEPLPDEKLKERFSALLLENGCTVKAIHVMDGSKRSSFFQFLLDIFFALSYNASVMKERIL